jgi:hypothetical protein
MHYIFGDYTFVVIDKNGKKYEKVKDLTINPFSYNQSIHSPAFGDFVNITKPTFTWTMQGRYCLGKTN